MPNNELDTLHDRDLFVEMVAAIESGINKHISSTLSYSAFRLFYKLFTSTNRNLMQQIRDYVKNDIFNQTQAIKGFNTSLFINGHTITEKGRTLLQLCYNIGIHLFKNELTPRKSFSLIKDSNFRWELYQHTLDMVQRVTSRVTHS